jgi:hypothetical protein
MEYPNRFKQFPFTQFQIRISVYLHRIRFSTVATFSLPQLNRETRDLNGNSFPPGNGNAPVQSEFQFTSWIHDFLK